VLLVKLAESLGLSPTELLKHLGPAFKTMLGGQGACCRCKATPQAEEGTAQNRRASLKIEHSAHRRAGSQFQSDERLPAQG